MAGPDIIGRTLLGQFVVVEKLAEGGMGALYLADQPSVGRRAVIKLLQPRLANDPEIAARFNLEARAAAALNHPHVVTVYGYGADNGALVLAMEHLEGRDLGRRLAAEGALPPARAVHVARQICDALGEAHRRGVVHRDLKPSNVMLTRRGRDADFVKVLDFGIAKVEGITLTGGKTVFGTPEYMSPEQLRGEKLDGRSDLYALGVLLFEAVSGRLPFGGTTPEAQMTAHLHELPPSLERAAPGAGVTPRLAAVVAQLLAKDRAARPADAEAAAEALEAALGATAATGERGARRGASELWSGLALAAVLAATGGGALLLARNASKEATAAPARVMLPAPHVTPPPATNPPPVTNPPPATPPATGAKPAAATTPTATGAKPALTPPPATPTTTGAKPAPATTGSARATSPAAAAESLPALETLERQFMTMPLRSALRPDDRRATLAALRTRIDAAGGTPEERDQRKRRAVQELIRQQAH